MYSFLQNSKPASTIIYIDIPNINIGFLPYMSPILAKVRHPATIPNKKKDPKSPTFISDSQKKSSYSIKLCILSSLSQSILQLTSYTGGQKSLG